jgi:flagella basal body P-ring formation protein FlgA
MQDATMQRKDCDKTFHKSRTAGDLPSARATAYVLSIALILCAAGSEALAGTVRLWPSAVVVDDSVRLDDLCELSGFDLKEVETLGSIVVIPAPPTGGSCLIHMDVIRAALTQAGANMALVTLHGATQCALSRPTVVQPVAASQTVPTESNQLGVGHADVVTREAGADRPAQSQSLREAVVGYFDAEFARYGGKAEVVFDRTSDQVLDLAGPPYEFNVRRGRGSLLGLTSLEVDVEANGRAVQTVPLAVQVSMHRSAVVARRSINQGATVRRSDVELVSMAVARLDKLGIDEVAFVIGQRAKRFISAGTLIASGMLESVPIVRRGELVRLTSVVGSIRVTTSGRVVADGVLGDVVQVRAADNKRIEFDGVVVGPGEVQIGSEPSERLRTLVASRDRS